MISIKQENCEEQERIKKDPRKIGKLLCRQIAPVQENNPEQKILSPSKSIGINTSKIIVNDVAESKVSQNVSEIQSTNKNFNIQSSVINISLNEKVHRKVDRQIKSLSKTQMCKQKFGSIKKQRSKKYEQLSPLKSFTTPTLQSIQKINQNRLYFHTPLSPSPKSQFCHENQSFSNVFANTHNSARQSPFHRTNNSTFNQNKDCEENEALKKKNNRNYFRIRNTKEVKLINQHQEEVQGKKFVENGSKMKQIQNQYNKDQNFSQSHHNIVNSQIFNKKLEKQHGNSIFINLRTSISRLKQLLIEENNEINVVFDIPSIFLSPLSQSATLEDYHHFMIEVFDQIGLKPQIVSIKKHINGVTMKEKTLCIDCKYDGSIYFGGWQQKGNMSEGNKHGIGIQWIPTKEIYYGQFKDNKKEGMGILKKANQQVYVGQWKNDQKWGWGKLFDKTSTLHQNGEFIEDEFVYK